MGKLIDAYVKYREMQEAKHGLPFEERNLVNVIPEVFEERISDGTEIEQNELMESSKKLDVDALKMRDVILDIRRFVTDVQSRLIDKAKDLGVNKDGYKVLRNR